MPETNSSHVKSRVEDDLASQWYLFRCYVTYRDGTWRIIPVSKLLKAI